MSANLTRRGWAAWGAVIAALIVLGLVAWRQSCLIESLREEVRNAGTSPVRSQARQINSLHSSEGARLADDDDLERLLRQLASGNVLDQYNAAYRIREYGDAAVPGLLAQVRSKSGQTRVAALLVLGDLKSPASKPGLRAILEEFLVSTGKEGTSAKAGISPEAAAGATLLLGRLEDRDSLPLMRRALDSSEDSVRVAAATSLRRINDTECIPALLARVEKEPSFVAREMERTLLDLFQRQPEKSLAQLRAAKPVERFTAVKLLSQDSAAGLRPILLGLGEDEDPRVALAAGRVLAQRGDSAARQIVERQKGRDLDADVKGIMADIITALDKQSDASRESTAAEKPQK